MTRRTKADRHIACPSWPNCDIDPNGCRVIMGRWVEEYGYRDHDPPPPPNGFTHWFSMDQHPSRVGWYEALFKERFDGGQEQMLWWDGTEFKFCPNAKVKLHKCHQFEWRGLSNPWM